MNQSLKYYFLSFIGLLSIICFFACEKEIELDLRGQEKLVVFSNFTPDSLFKLHLSTSFVNTDNNVAPTYPENATIQLFENGTYLENFIYQQNDPDEIPFYYSNVNPRVGVEYSIIADAGNHPTIKSNNIIPKKPIIENHQLVTSVLIECDEFSGVFENTTVARLKLPHDDAQPKYYHLRTWRNLTFFDIIGNDTITIFSYPVALLLTLPNNVDHTLTEHEPNILFSSKVFAESPEGIEISSTFFFKPDSELRTPIYLEIRQVSEDYYLFHKSVGEQESNSSSTVSLPSRSVIIHNNIDGGIGNFSGYNVTVDSLAW